MGPKSEHQNTKSPENRSLESGSAEITQTLAPPRFGLQSDPVQTKPENGAEQETAGEQSLALQLKEMSSPPPPANPMQRKEKGANRNTPFTPVQRKESGNGLPGDVQAKMENSFGADFSNVNVHQDSGSAQDMGALAYTQGNDVHFAPGQFKPDTQSGQELIGHELTHVVQQRSGNVPANTAVNGFSVNNDKGLENEADQMGAKAARGETAQQKSKASGSTGSGPAQMKEGESGGIQADGVPAEVIEHLKLREGWETVVYNDSEGLPTVGLGHLLVGDQITQYPLGTTVDTATLEAWAAADAKKAYDAAVAQAATLGVSSQSFINALASVNFQLGTSWYTEHKKTWAYLVAGEWEKAALEAADSTWNSQTPVRVTDFQEAIRALKGSTTPNTNTTTEESSSSTTTSPATNASGGVPYTVQSGESLGILAKKFNVTEAELKAANPDKLKKWGSVEGFEAGAVITIPGKAQAEESSPAPSSSKAKADSQSDSGGSGWSLGGLFSSAMDTLNSAMETVDSMVDSAVETATSWFGSLPGLLGGGSSNSQQETTGGEQGNTTQTPTTQPTNAPGPAARIIESVGEGGVNKASDVMIIQAHLIQLGYFQANAETAAVSAMQSDQVASAIPETIAAIKKYQKFGLGFGNPDGNVGPTGTTMDNMIERVNLVNTTKEHKIEANPIDQVLSNSQWISQFVDSPNNGDGRGLKESEKAYAGKNNNVCCWDAARAMIKQSGGDAKHVQSSRIPTMFQENAQDIAMGDQVELGAKYIDQQLLAGKPVMIGVDDGRVESYNDDNTTEHFIVIVGKVIKEGKIYYRFFDPGTSHGALKGYAETNLLYLGEDYSLSGDKPGSSTTDYKMAQVRMY